jgi:hypothetical protein
MTLISNSDSTLFGTIAAGEMSADELTAVGTRVFGGDPRGGFRAVLKINADMVDALMGGRIAVPAALAIALLRCCHGLPLLKQISTSLDMSDKTQSQAAKAQYALIMNHPNALSDANGDFQQCCTWSQQLTDFILLRLRAFESVDQ